MQPRSATVERVPDQTLSVSELGTLIRFALDQLVPDNVWVEGELRSKRSARNGHVYFDLIEPGDTPGGAPKALINVVLWRDARDRVNRLLTRHGQSISMDDGVRIRIQGAPDFYVAGGRLQFRMTAIDPTFTLGVLAADRAALLQALTEEGLLRANTSRRLPVVPLRVGLATSLGSAAHADVTTVFANSGLGFTLVEADTAVQGPGAEQQIAAAIGALESAGVDMILLVRGGGSKTDLAAFDHGVVARRIATAAVPVFTGIGHDIDRSVADEVAFAAHTTPTAAAQAVVALVVNWLRELDRAEQRLVQRTNAVLADAAARQHELRRRIVRAGQVTVAQADQRITATAGQVARAARQAVRSAELQLAAATTRSGAHDPARALARGWSITRTADGRVLRSVADATAGASLATQVADGVITSTIDDDE